MRRPFRQTVVKDMAMGNLNFSQSEKVQLPTEPDNVLRHQGHCKMVPHQSLLYSGQQATYSSNAPDSHFQNGYVRRLNIAVGNLEQFGYLPKEGMAHSLLVQPSRNTTTNHDIMDRATVGKTGILSAPSQRIMLLTGKG